jgi:hypothetical protein
MRRTILLSSVALITATFSAGWAVAGDRYGPPEPVKPASVSAAEWNGPLLGWSNKAASDTPDSRSPTAVSSKAAPSKFQPTVVLPSVPHAAPAQPAALPTSLYAPPPGPVAAATTIASVYQPAHPTGQVLNLSLADLPPPGPSLERQQAVEDDADVLAAQVARANALAAKDIAAGKPVTGGGSTDLLGGP